MSKKPIHSANPLKPKIMKAFKDKFSATKITKIIYDDKAKIYSANCFRKFAFLGNNQINEDEVRLDTF